MPRATHTLLPRTKFAKRHYEAIALAMQHAHVLDDPAKRNQWESVRNELADMFTRDNSQFQRNRFISACEPGANVRARTNGGAR
jgi:hypothetical protein